MVSGVIAALSWGCSSGAPSFFDSLGSSDLRVALVTNQSESGRVLASTLPFSPAPDLTWSVVVVQGRRMAVTRAVDSVASETSIDLIVLAPGILDALDTCIPAPERPWIALGGNCAGTPGVWTVGPNPDVLVEELAGLVDKNTVVLAAADPEHGPSAMAVQNLRGASVVLHDEGERDWIRPCRNLEPMLETTKDLVQWSPPDDVRSFELDAPCASWWRARMVRPAPAAPLLPQPEDSAGWASLAVRLARVVSRARDVLPVAGSWDVALRAASAVEPGFRPLPSGGSLFLEPVEFPAPSR